MLANASATASVGLVMANVWKCWFWIAVKPRRWMLPVIFSLFFALQAVSQSANAHRPNVWVSQQLNSPFPQEPTRQPDEELLRIEKENARRASEQRQLELRRDTDKLLQLTNELKQYVDKTNENILSLEVIRKAEEIERLAKSVKVKMKGKG
jgi:hypothetical protein